MCRSLSVWRATATHQQCFHELRGAGRRWAASRSASNQTRASGEKHLLTSVQFSCCLVTFISQVKAPTYKEKLGHHLLSFVVCSQCFKFVIIFLAEWEKKVPGGQCQEKDQTGQVWRSGAALTLQYLKLQANGAVWILYRVSIALCQCPFSEPTNSTNYFKLFAYSCIFTASALVLIEHYFREMSRRCGPCVPCKGPYLHSCVPFVLSNSTLQSARRQGWSVSCLPRS